MDGHADGHRAAAGTVADRIGTRPLLAAGLAAQAGGLAWFAAVAGADGGYGRFVLPLVIAGAGISMSIPTVASAALGAVPPAEMGTASGMNNAMQRFGGAIVTAVFTAHGSLASPAEVAAGVPLGPAPWHLACTARSAPAVTAAS